MTEKNDQPLTGEEWIRLARFWSAFRAGCPGLADSINRAAADGLLGDFKWPDQEAKERQRMEDMDA